MPGHHRGDQEAEVGGDGGGRGGGRGGALGGLGDRRYRTEGVVWRTQEGLVWRDGGDRRE